MPVIEEEEIYALTEEIEELKELLAEARHMLMINYPEDTPEWPEFQRRLEKALNNED